MLKDDVFFMKIALEQAKLAYNQDEVPIGAVIVKDNKVVAKAYNRKELDNVATYHAELLAIDKACRKLKTWHLEDCTLYTTVEPCIMCTGAIFQSRISRVVYGCHNPSFGYFSKLNIDKVEVKKGVLDKESLNILSTFFKKQRDKKNGE